MTPRLTALLLAGTVSAALAVPASAVDFRSGYDTPGYEVTGYDNTAYGMPGYDVMAPGDGSATNNSDLLRGAYECGSQCAFNATPRGTPGMAPGEPFNPPFDIDWSVALRASYVQQDGVGRYETAIVPAVTLTRAGLRSSFVLDGEAELVKPQDTVLRLAALRLAYAGEYGLDSVTNIASAGELTIEQAAPYDPSNLAGTATSPRVTSGEVVTTLTRDIGIAYLGLRGTVGRETYGETVLADGTVIDNTASNTTYYGAGLRVSHRLTPIVTAFADGSVTFVSYDTVVPAAPVTLDGTDYVLRGGLSAKRGTTLELEGSIGVALRRFEDASLADVRAVLYDASLIFRPNETLTLSATLGSSIGAPGPTGSGTASVEHTARAEAQYKVNSWWSLNGFASWRRETAVAAAEAETGYSVGAGSAYQLNRHVALTADYAFSQLTADGAAPVDTHRATVGVKVSR